MTTVLPILRVYRALNFVLRHMESAGSALAAGKCPHEKVDALVEALHVARDNLQNMPRSKEKERLRSLYRKLHRAVGRMHEKFDKECVRR